MAQTDRDVLFANESFLIGVLQAVSGASLAAGLSQLDPLMKLAGKLPFLSFLSAMVLALLAAVLAAYWKHEYKLWDVKSGVSASHGRSDEVAVRSDLTNVNLNQMRWAMKISVFAIVFGFGILITTMWFHAL